MKNKLISRAAVPMLAAVTLTLLFTSPSYARIRVLRTTEPCGARSAVVEGDRAYLLGGGSHLSVWDISDSSNIRELGRYDAVRDRTWQGNTINMKHNSYGINDGGIGQCRGELALASSGGRLLAFVPTGYHGLQAVDVTDPANVFGRGRGRYPDAGEGAVCAVTTRGNRVFMSANFGGFNIF